MNDIGPLRYRIINGVATLVPTEKPRSALRTARRITPILCWGYAIAVLGFWALVLASPVAFWPIHLILYGPSWLIAAPALVLIPLVIWLRLRWPAVAVGLALLGFLGVSGFNVPWRGQAGSATRPGHALRILTCNVQGKDLKIPVLAKLIQEARPDVVCLQECTLKNPLIDLGLTAWHVETSGEFCLASRYPIQEFAELRRPDKAYRTVAVRARLSLPEKDIPIAVLHLMTPRRGLEPLVEKKVSGLAAFREIAEVQRMESHLVRHWVERAPDTLVLAGDFNLTCEQPLYRRDWSDYRDAFAWSGWGWGHTMLTRLIGLRIDHILSGPRWEATRCEIGPDVGSAHLPVIADLAETP
jgi:endonuclease/exonuclease/phosphatase family metal-dependent hydrolase